jgi:hypothetical protein
MLASELDIDWNFDDRSYPSTKPGVLILPESSMVTEEFLIIFPVAKLNLAIALSVEDAGPTTSPVPDAVTAAQTGLAAVP